jgi:hypothetical protein
MAGKFTVFVCAWLLALTSAMAAEPNRVSDPDHDAQDIMRAIATNADVAANKITGTIGKPETTVTLANSFRIFTGKKFDFTKKVLDRDYSGALRQIIYYAYIEKLGFLYFKFDFKMTSTGWFMTNFMFKSENNELFPRDFVGP